MEISLKYIVFEEIKRCSSYFNFKSDNENFPEDIYDKLRKIISNKLKIKEEKIKLRHFFIYDLKANFVDLIEIIMDVEDKFNIKFSNNEIIKISTVEDALKNIVSKVKKS